MKRFIALLSLLLVACPHPSAPNGNADAGQIEAGSDDCNLDSGMVYIDAAPTAVTQRIEVHFSPKGGCQDAMVSHIQNSKKTIRMQAYTLSAKPIIDALVAAHARGVDVQVIIDSSESKLSISPVTALRAGGVPTFIDAKHLLAHNKVTIFDSTVVETGSYNYTNAAENDDADNCLFLEDTLTANAYTENWTTHQGHSTAAP